MARGRLAVAVAVAGALALSACGGLPTDSGIEQGLPVQGNPVQGVQVQGEPPLPDASPQAIVRGFLAANADFSSDMQVAREYLSRNLANEWEPSTGVLVRGEDIEITSPQDGTVSVTVTPLAAIDADGYYQRSSESSRVTETFELEQEDGQWRISSLPKNYGVWLDEPSLEQLYRPVAINYVNNLNAPDRVFVPDIRWFPRVGGFAAALSRALIGPVPPHLRGAVVQGVPRGTQLAVDAVPIEDGVARVDLQGEGLADQTEARSAMWAQFTQTLRQAPNVYAVQLLGNGSELEPSDLRGPLANPLDLGYRVQKRPVRYAVVREGEKLKPVDLLSPTLDDASPTALTADVPLPTVPKEWTDLAASEDGREWAAVSTDRSKMRRWINGEPHQTAIPLTGLTRPSFDAFGYLWVAGQQESRSRVVTVDTSQPVSRAVARQVSVPWLGTRALEQLRVAQDGVRALVVTTNDMSGTASVGLSGIVRDAEGRPSEVTAPIPVGPVLSDIVDVAWVDQETAVVLGQEAGSETVRAHLFQVGGESEELPGLAGTTDVTANPSETMGGLMLTREGEVYTRSGANWYFGRSADSIIVPGE